MKTIVGFFVLSLAQLVSWALLAANNHQIVVQDAIGRNIQAPSPAQRIVTVSFAAHEVIRLLGANDRLVGTTSYVQGHAGDLFPEVQKLPNVGHAFRPNLEDLAKLRPDLVIAWVANPGPEMERALNPLGIAVLRLNFSRSDTFKRELTVLTEILGAQAVEAAEKYNKWAGLLEEQLLAKVRKYSVRPTVMIEQLTEATIAGRQSGAAVLAKMLMANNLGEQFPGQFSIVANEWILRQNPQIFIKMFAWRNREDDRKLEVMRRRQLDQVLQRPSWDNIEAIRNKRVHILDADYCGGPRYIVGLYQMAGWLYPNLVLPGRWQEIEEEYFKLFQNF
ncbi:MAG: ABC transporter substrate-binding protein [Deltaproteobacteria bacterium]|jgi:iron complex transport system substrate-binding protein|nr:ABC transporter substrate-binding protein [Deltaproteobacteria bacterium]